MKLIACLVILSLFFAFWSSGFMVSTISEIPKDHAVLDQSFDRPFVRLRVWLRTPLHIGQSFERGWWTWDVWAEWLCLTRRPRRKWSRFLRLLRKLRRWHRQRVRRWCLLRREWRELMEGTSQVKPFVGGSQPRSVSPMTIPQVPSQEAPSAITAPGTVEETTQPVQRGPGRPRTIPTDHLCCPGRDCSSYGIFGPHPDHDIVGNGTYTTAHGEKRQMYLCQVCKQPFSETAGTPFFDLKTPMRKVCIALSNSR